MEKRSSVMGIGVLANEQNLSTWTVERRMDREDGETEETSSRVEIREAIRKPVLAPEWGRQHVARSVSPWTEETSSRVEIREAIRKPVLAPEWGRQHVARGVSPWTEETSSRVEIREAIRKPVLAPEWGRQHVARGVSPWTEETSSRVEIREAIRKPVLAPEWGRQHVARGVSPWTGSRDQTRPTPPNPGRRPGLGRGVGAIKRGDARSRGSRSWLRAAAPTF